MSALWLRLCHWDFPWRISNRWTRETVLLESQVIKQAHNNDKLSCKCRLAQWSPGWCVMCFYRACGPLTVYLVLMIVPLFSSERWTGYWSPLSSSLCGELFIVNTHRMRCHTWCIWGHLSERYNLMNCGIWPHKSHWLTTFAVSGETGKEEEINDDCEVTAEIYHEIFSAHLFLLEDLNLLLSWRIYIHHKYRRRAVQCWCSLQVTDSKWQMYSKLHWSLLATRGQSPITTLLGSSFWWLDWFIVCPPSGAGKAAHSADLSNHLTNLYLHLNSETNLWMCYKPR